MAKLEARHLTIRYGEATAVEDLSFALGDDEILTLVGPTGCGKTSVLRAVAGLVAPSDGEIQIGALTVDRRRQPPPEKRRVGLVFQDFALFPHLDVAANVAFRLRDSAPADHWIDRLGLAALRRAMPDTLSGGQKQRVALARALAHAPDVLLLDEPLASLDAALKTALRWEIREALKSAGVPAIWVTHDQTEALAVGDRLGVMNAGRLEQIDTPDRCFRRPASRFVASFLGDALFLAGRRETGGVDTVLGRVAIEEQPGDGLQSGQLDVLLRPDDLALRADGQSNARVLWSRFEGETRLYGVALDGGDELRIRANHAEQHAADSRVEAYICAGHELAAFTRAPAANESG